MMMVKITNVIMSLTLSVNKPHVIFLDAFDAADDSNDNDYPPLEDLGGPPVPEQEGFAPDDNGDDDHDDNDHDGGNDDNEDNDNGKPQ